MGYCSSIVIGIDKKVLARNLLVHEIPECLKEFACPIDPSEDAAFYYISSLKWYDSYEEIQAIEKWFDSMDAEEFGAMRIGENFNDIQTWGSPSDFEIYVSQSITYPKG